MAYELPTTNLGRTGLVVTRLGIGGAYCPSVDGYRAALDCGVNYVDTARAYRDGADEEIIGLRSLPLFALVVAAVADRATLTPGEREELETYAAPRRASGQLD